MSTPAITRFQGQYRWLSNFWPCIITFEDVVYPSVENAYQAAKTTPDQRGPFQLHSAGEAKRLGKRVVLPADWDTRKLRVMNELIRAKFRSPALTNLLLVTGNAEIIEGNTWGDTFWGVCRGKGENNLGKILMQVREELRSRTTTGEMK